MNGHYTVVTSLCHHHRGDDTLEWYNDYTNIVFSVLDVCKVGMHTSISCVQLGCELVKNRGSSFLFIFLGTTCTLILYGVIQVICHTVYSLPRKNILGGTTLFGYSKYIILIN